jgi:hypothetical protein
MHINHPFTFHRKSSTTLYGRDLQAQSFGFFLGRQKRTRPITNQQVEELQFIESMRRFTLHLLGWTLLLHSGTCILLLL